MKTITTTLSIFALLLSTAGFSGVKNEFNSKQIMVSTKKTNINLSNDIDPVVKPRRPLKKEQIDLMNCN